MSLKESNATAGAMLVSVSLAVTTFTAILPPFREVRRAHKTDPDMREDVRLGEIAATALVVGVGVMASGVAGSPAPVAASIACAIALVVMYETILAR